MNDIERIEAVVRKNGLKSLNALARKLGYPSGTIFYNIKSGRNGISRKLVSQICDAFPETDSAWLLTGKGKMLNNEIKEVQNEENNVPYYDVDFTASFLEVDNTQQTTPNSYISHPFFKGCDYVVRASGQSMAKVIAHGDAIGLIKLKNWYDFLPFGEIYAIVTHDGHRMIKVITKGETEDTYTLISKPTDNKKDDFPSQQIKKDNIMNLFKVQASSHLF